MKKLKFLSWILAFSLVLYGLFPGAPVLAAETDISVDALHFPDAVFREWILDPSNLSGAGEDGVLTQQELASIETIFLPTTKGTISSLEGIQYFTNLRQLTVKNHSLTSLDVSQNTRLESLNCSFNRLTSLNLQGASALTSLSCENNRLTALDLSGNPQLLTLYARYNLLEELNVTKNTQLKILEVFDNRLTSLDVSSLSQLEILYADYNRLTRLDVSQNTRLQSFGLSVSYNELETLILPNIPGVTIPFQNFGQQTPQSGYEQTGWFSDPSYTSPVTDDIQAQGQTLYSRRLANQYTVYFSPNGGKGTMNPISDQFDTPFSLPEATFTQYGYTFLRWNTIFNGTGNAYDDQASVENIGGRLHG